MNEKGEPRQRQDVNHEAKVYKKPKLSRRALLAGAGAVALGVVGGKIYGNYANTPTSTDEFTANKQPVIFDGNNIERTYGTDPSPEESASPNDLLIDDIDSNTPPVEYNYDNFIQKYQKLAEEVQQKYGIPYQVTLSMGMLETGYGGSVLATEAHNFFGMKVNNEWPAGPEHSFTQITSEDILKADLKKYKIIGEPTDIGEGYRRIVIEDSFKKFENDTEGFMGFGEHLKTRYGGQAYADVFAYKDPYEFVRALFDDKGAVWATDRRYVEKIYVILDKITGEDHTTTVDTVPEPSQTPTTSPKTTNSPTPTKTSAKPTPVKTSAKPTSKSPEVSKINITMRGWNELSSVERGQFVGGKAEYDKVAKQLLSVKTSTERYKTFVSKIRDVSGEIKKMPGASKMFPGSKFKLFDNPRVVFHHTAWQSKSAWSYDYKKFFKSLINTYESNGNKVSANGFVGRGKNDYLALLTAPGEAAYHAGRMVDGYERYSGNIGVEFVAGKQSDITTEMYESAVYVACWLYRKYNGNKKPTQSEMRRFVIGHGEIAEHTNNRVTTHNDFPRAVVDVLSDLAYNFLQYN